MQTYTMKNLYERWQRLRTEIEDAEQQFGREPGSVKLLAVSKTRDAADILALAQLGLRTSARITSRRRRLKSRN